MDTKNPKLLLVMMIKDVKQRGGTAMLSQNGENP